MHVIIKLPWNRNVECQPRSEWTCVQDQQLCAELKKCSIQTSQTAGGTIEVDWKRVSSALNVSVEDCFRRANYLFSPGKMKASSALNLPTHEEPTVASNSAGRPRAATTGSAWMEAPMAPSVVALKRKSGLLYVDVLEFFKCAVLHNFDWDVVSRELDLFPPECAALYAEFKSKPQFQQYLPQNTSTGKINHPDTSAATIQNFPVGKARSNSTALDENHPSYIHLDPASNPSTSRERFAVPLPSSAKDVPSKTSSPLPSQPPVNPNPILQRMAATPAVIPLEPLDNWKSRQVGSEGDFSTSDSESSVTRSALESTYLKMQGSHGL